jgi:hypothetical protein
MANFSPALCERLELEILSVEELTFSDFNNALPTPSYLRSSGLNL